LDRYPKNRPKEVVAVTHEQRNAAIMEKIKLYTQKHAGSCASANTALTREGFTIVTSARKKGNAAA
jgi:hypothetical protein